MTLKLLSQNIRLYVYMKSQKRMNYKISHYMFTYQTNLNLDYNHSLCTKKLVVMGYWSARVLVVAALL